MKKKNRIGIFLLICSISIGYALLTSSFTFGGITSVLGNTWDLHLENVQVLEGSVTGPTPTIESNRVTVNFTTTLTEPGDFYSFTVDVVNGGSIAAEVESIEKNQLNEYASKYIRYEILNASDDSEVEQGEEIAANSRTTYKVIVEYREDILATDLYGENQNLTFEFTINFTKANLRGDYNKSVFARLIRKDAYTDKVLNFGTATNGKGIYTVYGTEKDRYPIYYYRGDIDYNNAKFAGFCWKIVRTTETGGTKLIYNGLPDEDGYCTATDTDTQIGTSIFNTNHQLPLDAGYMYGDAYGYLTMGHYDDAIWGKGRASSFSYDEESGIYTLINPTTNYSTYHYTCLSTNNKCTQIRYIYNKNGNTLYYIPLKYGDSIEDILQVMNTTKYNSLAKEKIDTWFEENIIPYFENKDQTYNSYIEDTVWCNDRSFAKNTWSSSGWNPYGSSMSNNSYYGANERGGRPVVDCPNKNDSFTVRDNKKGNGVLTYPVGMLTRDELVLAGNESGYLGSSGNWWTMSPHVFDANSAYLKLYTLSGSSTCNTELGIRPSISIRPEVLVKEGTDGTATNPYEFLVQ